MTVHFRILYASALKPTRMAAKSITMEQLKQVLNLCREGKSIKGIVRLTGLSRNTVRTYLSKSTEEIDHAAPQSDAALADVF